MAFGLVGAAADAQEVLSSRSAHVMHAKLPGCTCGGEALQECFSAEMRALYGARDDTVRKKHEYSCVDVWAYGHRVLASVRRVRDACEQRRQREDGCCSACGAVCAELSRVLDDLRGRFASNSVALNILEDVAAALSGGAYWCAVQCLSHAFEKLAPYVLALAHAADPHHFHSEACVLVRGYELYVNVLQCPLVPPAVWSDTLALICPLRWWPHCNKGFGESCAESTFLARIHYGHAHHLCALAVSHPHVYAECAQALMFRHSLPCLLQHMCDAGRVELVDTLCHALSAPDGCIYASLRAPQPWDVGRPVEHSIARRQRDFAQCVRVTEWRALLVYTLCRRMYDLTEAVCKCLALTVQALESLGTDVHAWVTQVQAPGVVRSATMIALVMSVEDRLDGIDRGRARASLLSYLWDLSGSSTHYARLLRCNCSNGGNGGTGSAATRSCSHEEVPAVLLSLLDEVLKNNASGRVDAHTERQIAYVLCACVKPVQVSHYSSLVHLISCHGAYQDQESTSAQRLTPLACAELFAGASEYDAASVAQHIDRCRQVNVHNVVVETWSRALSLWHREPAAAHCVTTRMLAHAEFTRGIVHVCKPHYAAFTLCNLSFVCRALSVACLASSPFVRHLYRIACALSYDASWFVHRSASQYLMREFCNTDLCGRTISHHLAALATPCGSGCVPGQQGLQSESAPTLSCCPVHVCTTDGRCGRYVLALWNHTCCLLYAHVSSLLVTDPLLRRVSSAGCALFRSRLLTRLFFVISGQLSFSDHEPRAVFTPSAFDCTVRCHTVHCKYALSGTYVLCALDPHCRLTVDARMAMAAVLGPICSTSCNPSHWQALVHCPHRVRHLVCRFLAHV